MDHKSQKPAEKVPYNESFDRNIRGLTLPSGLTLLHVPLAHTASFYIGATIAAGTRLESQKILGISHFLEHMMFRGSKKHPDYAALAEAFETLGGEWNAATSHEHTEYWYSGISHTAEGVVELFADFILNPCLLEIETERQIILRELDGETNDLGHSTDLDGHVASLMWPDSSVDRPILGTRESLSRITLADLKSYRERFYTPDRTIICAIGGPDGLLDSMTKHFDQPMSQSGALKKSAVSPPSASPEELSYPILPPFVKGPKVKWVEHNDNEYEIKLSFVCPHEWSTQGLGVHLISRILGDGFSSRLTRHLREKLGLVYDISAQANLGIDHGTLDIDATCAAEQLDDFLKELLTLVRNFRDAGATKSEYERVKFRSLVDLELSLNHPEALGGRLSWSRLCRKSWNLTQQTTTIKEHTLEALNQLIGSIFVPENLALVALGPEGDTIHARIHDAIKRYF